MNDDEIFSISLDIGREIIRAGGEISRATDTIIRINGARGSRCEVFALPSVIIAECDNNIQIRHISGEETDLRKISMLNAISRNICSDRTDKIEIGGTEKYSTLTNYIFVAVATLSFSLYFGGNLLDGTFSAITAMLISALMVHMSTFPVFTTNLISSFLSAVIAYLPLLFGLKINPDKVIIGAIMLLVPGLTIVNSITDMMKGDLIAGIFELFYSIMTALAIAFGVAGGIWVMKWI